MQDYTVMSLRTDADMETNRTRVQYLEAADGCLPTDNWISMADLSEGGMVRGAGFDREIDNMIADRLGKYLPKHIHAACERLGATFHNDSHADLCADFCFLPFFPLRLNLWFADDGTWVTFEEN